MKFTRKLIEFSRFLDRGSVILFGSNLGGQFVLDTCFVVKDFIDLIDVTRDEVLARVPPVFR